MAQASGMKYSLRIGKLSGINIFIHWSFPIIIIWVLAANIQQGLSGADLLWPVLFVLTLFACVTLHELGHALAARRYGIGTRDITLLPIGGLARLDEMPEKPAQELWVALAGPAVNVVIFLILYAILGFTQASPTDIDMSFISASNFLPFLATVNVWLVVFNLIPAFPMDGGRVLRALLAMKLGRLQATQWSAAIGQAIAIGFILLGLYANPFLIIIGVFIIFSARAEAGHVEIKSFLDGHTAGAIVMRDVPVLNESDPVEKAVEALLNGQSKNFLVVDNNNTPVGTLNGDGIIKALHEAGNKVPVGSVANRNLAYVTSSEPLDKVLTMIQAEKHPLVLVTTNRELIGVIDQDNIVEFIMVLKATAKA